MGFSTRCILAGVLVVSAVIAPAADYTNYTGFAIDPIPVLPAKETHPSLWFRADEIPAMRAKKDADEHAKKLWEIIQNSPYLTRELAAAPAATDKKEDVQGYYGDCSQQAMLNAFMALLEEDKAKADKFRARAVDALKRAFDGPIYEMDPRDSGSGVDEIYQGVWAQNYAAAYDWVQPSLDAATDKAIRERFAKEAQYLYDNLYDFASRPHNHQSKPAWGMGSIALAISSEPNAKQWLQRAIESSNMNSRAFFSEDGIYREGSHYYIFSAINFVPFLYHYRNVSGVDGFAAWQPAFEWPVLVRNSKGWMPNIEDAYIKPYPSQLVAAAYMNSKTRLSTKEPLGKVLQWNFKTTDYGPFDKSSKDSGFNYSGASMDYPLELVEYLCYVPSLPTAAPDVSPTVFLDSGETVFRNSWSHDGPGQRYLLFQSVAEADNHEHLEHLSFIMQAEGQMMAADAGYSRKSYGEKIRTEWYRTPEAHNVITANGEAPVDPAENWTPPSYNRIDTRYFDFEEKRAPFKAGGVQCRAIAFPGEEYFIVMDRVILPEERELSLNLHGGRGTMAQEGGMTHWNIYNDSGSGAVWTFEPCVWKFEQDTYGPTAMLAAWILAPGAKFTKKMGEITYIKGDYAEFPYIDATVTAKEEPFMQILWPTPAENGALPTVEELSENGHLAARIKTTKWTDLVAVQLRPAEMTVEGIKTDACYLWHRSGEGVAAWSAAEVTRVTLPDGRTMAFSGPVGFAARAEKEGVAVSIATEAPVTLKYTGANGTVSDVAIGKSGEYMVKETAK